MKHEEVWRCRKKNQSVECSTWGKSNNKNNVGSLSESRWLAQMILNTSCCLIVLLVPWWHSENRVLAQLKVQSAILIQYTSCQSQWMSPHTSLAAHSVWAVWKIYCVCTQPWFCEREGNKVAQIQAHTTTTTNSRGGWGHDFEQTDRSSNETDRAGKTLWMFWRISDAAGPLEGPPVHWYASTPGFVRVVTVVSPTIAGETSESWKAWRWMQRWLCFCLTGG